MVIKGTDVKRLEEQYQKTGNQLLVVYGRLGSGKEQLLMDFAKGKKYFYYRCRQASPQEQRQRMGQELAMWFNLKFSKDSYDEFFNRIKAGGPEKLVIIIDEAQNVVKKDPEFMESILRLKNKKLYPGPVTVILASSSTVWVEQELDEVLGDGKNRLDAKLKVGQLNFLDVVRAMPNYSVSDAIKVYGVIGGVPEYLDLWDVNKSIKANICDLILSKKGVLFHEAERVISAELRELSVYNTILSAIAQGNNKLNDLYHETGFSRAKISVYMKNLAQFDIIEKVVSFETGGWDNAKRGVYQIKDTFINFWYKFVYPNMSELFQLEPEEFYASYIEDELDTYLNRYFQNVCMEYMALLNQIGRVPFPIHKMGTWIGKSGKIDIIAQSSDRRNIVGLCNWDKPFLTMEMCDELFDSMQKAKITSDHFYLFSAKAFEIAVVERAKEDSRFELIDMNEL